MLKKLLLITFSATLCLSLFSAPVQAEDDIDCSGRIEGQAVQSNPNVGTMTFDAHPYNAGQKLPEKTVYNVNTKLGIVGSADGLAPATRGAAACISKKSTVKTVLAAGEYAVRNYAWSENIGFISFNCDTCGANNYGVKVVKNGAGYKLTDYAWNEAFGYIQMNDGNPADAINYGVTIGADGKASGYAYSAAGIYINFTGVKFFLPGVLPDDPTDYCNSLPLKPVCVQISPDPDALKSVTTKIDGDVKIADGKDFYDLHLYLRDAAGNALDLNKALEVNFDWLDTVKANQVDTATAGLTFNKDATPVSKGGGVTFKPVTITNANINTYFDNKGGGHYQLKPGYTIRSYSPTTNENFSYTTSTTPAFPVNNETFFAKLSGLDVDKIKSNDLILKSLQVKYDNVAVPTVYPNGKDGLKLRFRPAFEVKMFANNGQDSILGVRGIPVNYSISGKEVGNLDESGLKISFNLDYDKEATKAADVLNCSADAGSFLIHFLKDFSGVEQPNTQSELSVNSISAISSEQNLQSWAILPPPEVKEGEEAPAESPCKNVAGPTLYSKVSYKADGGKPFAYFSDKLPRLNSQIANPVAVVKGNILASKAFSPDAEKSIQETGNIAVNIIRNTIHENIETKVKAALKNNLPEEGGVCTITNLKVDGTVSANGADCGPDFYRLFKIGDENVIYFNDSEVTLNLSAQAGKWTVISEDANMFVDSGIFNDPIKTLSLVALRPYSSGCNIGNIYIHKGVKNLQANIFTDCSVFSYADKAKIDAGTGLYKWASFMEMVESLSNQLVIQGSIASHNTIGGADTDELGYLRDGFGKVYKLPVSVEVRLDLQKSDLNFLRLSKGELMKAENGLPIDQSCKKALSIEEILAVQKYNNCVDGIQSSCLADGSLPPEVTGEDGAICDGINPLKFATEGGDLMPVLGNLAKGLEEGDYYPVYVFYVPTDSFVFSTKK